MDQTITVDRKRILMVSSEFPPGPGGIGHHAFCLAKGLSRAGHSMEVLTVSDYATEEMKSEFDTSLDFPIGRFPRIGWRTYPNRVATTLEKVGKGSYDWVFLTGKFALWTGLALKMRFPRQKTLSILHGSEVKPSKRAIRMLTVRSIASSDIVVAVSKFTSNLLPYELRERLSPTIIPNGIDPLELGRSQLEEGTALKGSPSLLTVGHVSRRKGQHRVIRALPELARQFPEVHYHIVGRPIERTTLENLAAEIGVSEKITFHGTAKAHSDLAGFYRNADIFMLLSENQSDGDVEGFGIVALEANHFGLPVIGARFCGVEDAVDDRRSGFLVDGDDVGQISSAVKACVASREELRSGSRDWADRHSWEKIIPRYEELIS